MEDLSPKHEDHLQINTAETITISLEDAAKLIFQQQGIGTDGEGRLQPGTYQIITQPMTSLVDGQMHVSLGEGISIVQTADGLQGFELGGHSVVLQQQDGNQEDVRSVLQLADGTQLLSTSGDITHLEQVQSTLVESETEQMDSQDGTIREPDPDGQSENVLQIDLANNQSERMFQMINHPNSANQLISNTDDDDDDRSIMDSDGPQYTVSLLNTPPPRDTSDTQASQESVKISTTGADGVQDSTAADENQSETPQTTTVRVEKKPDLSKPIEVTDRMEVVINGKKCQLKVNPDTGQVCAYPLVTPSTGKRRGRPRKSETQSEETSKDSEAKMAGLAEQTSSAAEGLLELSNTGPDGVRRSGRSRKKAKTLEDYDMLDVSSDDDAAADNAEDEVLPTGAIRKRKLPPPIDFMSTIPQQTPVRRGRGRPRRYPRPDTVQVTNQIPAMIIPSSDGQTIMMAPIQGLTNLEAFQEQVKNLTILQQPLQQQQQSSSSKDDLSDDTLQFINSSSLIQLPDGSQVSLSQIDAANLASSLSVSGMSSGRTDAHVSGQTDGQTNTDMLGQTQEMTAETSAVSSESMLSLVNPVTDSLSESTGLTSNTLLDSEDGLKLSTGDPSQPTIIQIPENLLPMFMQKKDPIKIGLKADDNHLSKFKCSKCGFQAYYEQQYQAHIVTHSDSVEKCKCCAFTAFTKEEVIKHFKLSHPRCICTVCDYTAEHAYVIKRHMMRHTQDGCKCDVCGKVYKDQYVLKMHIKMVHLPAEVLFECTICTKKFTRKAHLKRHLRIHDPEKPFKCPHCTYRGCERSDISKHLLIHEEPKHVCEVCGKAFRHVKNKELHLKRHSGQRDYKCGVCDFYGYTFTDIRKHIERKHTDSKTFICDKCGSAFKSELVLREHKSKQCDMFMIEQALSIATSNGGTTHATIQIPSNYSLDGHQIQVDGQNISIDNNGHISVEADGLSDGITLTEVQLQAAVSQGQVSENVYQAVVSQGQITGTEFTTEDGNQIQISAAEYQAAVSQGHITDSGELIHDITRNVHFVEDGEERGTVTLTEDVDDEDEEEDEEEFEEIETDMGEDELRAGMSGLVSGGVEDDDDDDDDKQDMVRVNEQMMGMVHIIR